MKIFNTLYSKLSLTLFGLVFIIGFLFFLLVRFSSEMYQQEVSQKLNKTLADHIVSEALLIKDKKINKEALKEIFHMLMVINPSIEIYLLDADGKVLDYSAPEGKVKRKSVDTGKIKKFINSEVRFPVLGDDPRNLQREKVFSAARIPAEGPLEGYLYVILGGEEFDSVSEMLQGSYILSLSMWGLAAGMIVAMLGGFAIFFVLTRRLRKLSHAMLAFTGSRDEVRSQARYDVQGTAKDEIDVLGQQFNTMADQIEEHISELKKTDQIRRELVANVSHDLRTPLASMVGYLETLLLKDDSLPKEQRTQYLKTALNQSQHLGELVAELFELAKLDSYETVVYSEPFSMGELMQDVTIKYQLDAKNRNIELKTEFGSAVPQVYGDIGLMQRVLENLIENALRHTPAGGSVTLALVPDVDNVVVKVADTGCGIPKEEMERIFDRFYRLEKSRQSDKGDNAGLGLAIASRILELHQSQIRVESEVDVGTTFLFNLPVKQTHHPHH